MPGWPIRKNDTAGATLVFPIYDNDGDLVTAAAALDSERSIDQGTFTDVTAEASEIATASGMYSLALSQAEVNGDEIAVITKTSTTDAKTAVNVVYTSTRNIDDLAFPTVSGRSVDVTATGAAGIDWANVENPTTALDLSATDIQLADTVTTLTGHTNQTGDNFARLGAPAGASVSADVAAVQSDTDDIQTRIPAVGPVEGTSDSGTSTTMVDAIRTEADDYWNGGWIIFTSGTLNGVVRLVSDFVASSDTMTVTPATPVAIGTHTYRMIPAAQIEEVLALTGHTVQTGDSFARLGAPAGASVSADVAVIEGQTDDIGVAGAGLTGIPWNAAWDVEVQSEVDDALDTALTELSQAAPAATPTMRTGLMLLYMALRNRLDIDTTATDFKEIYNNAGTVIAKKTLTDDGTIYSEAQMATGP